MSRLDSLRLPLTLAAIAAGLFMGLLDTSIVTIVIPEIGRSLDADLIELSWVLNAYVLAVAAMIIPAGKLGDLIGRKRVFLTGIALFASASLMCGLAPGVGFLIAFRALQGLGGAAMVTLSLAIVSQLLPEDKKALGWSLWGATGGLALAAGPSLGGLLTEIATWRWVFFVNVPIAAAALPVLLWGLEERRGERAIAARVDWAGLATIVVGLGLLSLGLLQGEQWGWRSTETLALLAVASVLLAAFFAIETVVENPMVPLKYFRNPRFSAACAGWFSAMFAFIALFFFLPLFLQVVQGYSVLKAAMALSPGPFTSFFVAPMAGFASRRVGPGPLGLLGVAIIAAGVLVTSGIDTGWPYERLVLIMVFVGVGFGLAVPTFTELAMGAVAARDAGIGSGVFNTVRQVSAVLAVSVLGAVLQQRMVSSFSESLSRSSLIAPQFQQPLLEQFHDRAAQRGALGNLSVPPEAAREIERIASLAVVDGLHGVFIVAGCLCLAGLAVASVLLLRARSSPVAVGARTVPRGHIQAESLSADPGPSERP